MLNAVAFSADGRRLAVAAETPVVSVWDAKAGRVVTGTGVVVAPAETG
jgi:hypothetical protein